MADNNRKDPRAKVLSMTVRYKSATLDEFIEHHSHDVSRGGMYIKTPQPFPPGTLLKFEVKIAADQKVMQGVGRVVWRRQSDEATDTHPAGMGVKFIKLDEESKGIIGQLVTKRTGDTSAFDEVPASAEAAPTGASEPPLQATPAATANFFPAGTDSVPPPAAEDRTVMKQAAELLQEALREVGTSTTSSVPPEARRESVPAVQPTRVATTTPAPGTAGARPASQTGPGMAAVRGKMPSTPAASETKPASTVPPAQAAAAAASQTPPPAQVDAAQPKISADSKPSKDATASSTEAKPSESAKEQSPVTAAKVKVKPAQTVAKPTVTDAPKAIKKAADAVSAAQAETDDVNAGLPTRRASSGGGVRSAIMFIVIAVLAGAIYLLTRKSEPPPAAEPAPTVVEKVEPPAPAVPTIASAAPTAEASATAAVSAAPPPTVEKPVEPVKAPEPTKPDVTAAKSKVTPAPAAPRRRAANVANTAVASPESPSDTTAPKSGPGDTPTKSGSDKAPATPPPAPAEDENPL